MAVNVTTGGASASATANVASLAADLQTVWNASSGSQKNTFVDANGAEISTYLDGLTWAEMVTAFGRGYHYPPSGGQVTSYRTGDDKHTEDNIFTAAVRDANTKKIFNTLVSGSITTLTNNNAWGNTNRYTAEDGTQTYTANLCIDNLTGLMWYLIGGGNSNWNAAIDGALASTQGGFSDWFLPSSQQLFTVTDHALTGTHIVKIGPSTFNMDLWSSTTRGSTTTQAFYSANNQRIAHFQNKTNADNYLICRKHY